MSDGPYDPNAVEGDKSSGGQYIQRKDLKVWGIALVVLGVASFPIYKVLEGNSERHVCINNLGEMYKAIQLYAGEHDNRLPPVARTEADGFTPSLGEGGHPYTWVSDVDVFMTKRASFLCPTASPEENVLNESAAKANATVPSSYGMYTPYGSVLVSLIESPDAIVLVAETSNRGAKTTLDPTPYGEGLPDGFAIGWNNSNAEPDKKTDAVTRLAFPGSAKGTTLEGRHGNFIQALTASGELIKLSPEDAAYRFEGVSGAAPHWKLPPGYRGPGG